MARIVIDSFFHMMPGHRLSRNIAVGGYICNYGRYSPYDMYHPNGASMLLSDLMADHDVRYSTQPFAESTLFDADLLIIPNPDYPLYEGASPYRIDSHDIDALLNFLRRGGSVLLLVNSFYPKSDFWEENFDIERVNPLFEKLGLTWDGDYMSDDMRILPALGDGLTVGYGQGGRVKNAALPSDAKALLTFEDCVYGFTKQVGAGTIAVIGDAGLVSNGLYGFPTFDNREFLNRLIARLAPDKAAPARFEHTAYGNISCAPAADGISEALLRGLRTGATYRVDHHYRHLVWEDSVGAKTAGEVLAALPFPLEGLSEKEKIEVPIPLIPVQEGKTAKTCPMKLTVCATKKRSGTEYFITGTHFFEGLSWEEAGADPAVFGEIGELLRINVVVQIELATDKAGSLRYACLRRGQILYDRNVKNPHYGYDILLGSSCDVYSPLK